jgi:hypothetical protein
MSDKFELTENAAVEDHKAANAAQHISNGVPLACIDTVELEALHAMIEAEFREREEARTRNYAAMALREFDDVIAQLKRPF